MANKYTYRTGFELLRALPIKSGVVAEIGDHLMISGGGLTPVAAATDNLAFIAVCKEAHRAVDSSGEITVAIRNANAIYEVDLDAATDITMGDDMQLNGDQDLKKSGTDAVAQAVESKLQATAVRVIYKIPATTGALNFIGDAS